jgi:hypothetical protein
MSYLDHAAYIKNEDITKAILDIPKTGFKPNPNTGVTWSPIGVTWHNTSNPSLGLWNSWKEETKRAWGDNLISYYKGLGWHAPPHAVATPEGYAIQLGDWLADGVHASCYNRDHFGVETVGNFATKGDDPTTGRGLEAMQSAANIIASLCKRFGWDPTKSVNFHRQCTADNHACPGNLVSQKFAFQLVKDRLAQLS